MNSTALTCIATIGFKKRNGGNLHAMKKHPGLKKRKPVLFIRERNPVNGRLREERLIG